MSIRRRIHARLAQTRTFDNEANRSQTKVPCVCVCVFKHG
jgi:hypothetical protein